MVTHLDLSKKLNDFYVAKMVVNGDMGNGGNDWVNSIATSMDGLTIDNG